MPTTSVWTCLDEQRLSWSQTWLSGSHFFRICSKLEQQETEERQGLEKASMSGHFKEAVCLIGFREQISLNRKQNSSLSDPFMLPLINLVNPRFLELSVGL